MPTVSCGDVEVFYEESGTGQPIIWIPGTGLLGSTWERHQVSRFAARYRCLTLDLRGSGRTQGGGTSFTVADMADDVAGLMDMLGIASAHVAGLSLGSAVVQELALRRPDLVRSAVLVATWSSTEHEHHIRRHFASRLYALEHGPLDVFGQFAFWMSAPSVIDHEPDLQRDVERELAAHTSKRVDGMAGHFQADLSHETRDRLGAITCPTLVLHGTEDLITLPWYNEQVAKLIPHAVGRSIPRAGHLVWLERPQELNDHIEEFLASA
ncbi:MAG: alpha/beta hydrolase fold protein [Actinoallomurus sp.]|nr:alpha/beta hydrolase fold protein [Actinoallomurus sp.]